MAIMVSSRRLRYVGHIEGGDDVNLTKIILHAELGNGCGQSANQSSLLGPV
jgi:hypothetical protein